MNVSPRRVVSDLRLDLADLLLGFAGLCVVVMFAVYAVPNLVAIYAGNHRALSLPDGRAVRLDAALYGQVDLVRREGAVFVFLGWLRNPAAPAAPTRFRVYYGPTLMIEAEAATPGTDRVYYRQDVPVPADYQTSEPFRVFLVMPDGRATEIFRGASPVFPAEDTSLRPTVSAIPGVP